MVYCGRIDCVNNVISSVGNCCCSLEYLYLDNDGKCSEYDIDKEEKKI